MTTENAVRSPIPPPPPARVLSAADMPLVWIDCEMSGLSEHDILLEVAVIITDGNLVPVDEGVSYIISTPKAVLDGMDEWCTKTHGETGLTAACQNPDIAYPHIDVRTAVLAYILDRVPEKRTACLAGSSVHADKVFLVREMPEVRRVLTDRGPFTLSHCRCLHHQGACAAVGQ